MIPTIETIVDDLAAGLITKQQAIAWLYAHAEDAGSDLRDHFASQALIGWWKIEGSTYEQDAKSAYAMADAMLVERGRLT